MASISFENGRIEVDAALIAKGLQLTPQALQAAMRAGQVTSQCEQGMAEDAGRFRITFYAPTRRLRLITDAAGTVLHSSSVAYFRSTPPPASLTGR